MPPIQDTIETTAALLQIVSSVCSVLRGIFPTRKPTRATIAEAVVDLDQRTQTESKRS